jgi:hypothetical protein
VHGQQELDELKITKRAIPQYKPIQIEPVEKDLPDSLKAFNMSDVPRPQGFTLQTGVRVSWLKLLPITRVRIATSKWLSSGWKDTTAILRLPKTDK